MGALDPGQTCNTLRVRALSQPLDLDEAIRADIWTSDTPEHLAGHVQQDIGEYPSSREERHVRHTIAPDRGTGPMLYTALIVLRPGHDENRPGDLNAVDAAHGPKPRARRRDRARVRDHGTEATPPRCRTALGLLKRRERKRLPAYFRIPRIRQSGPALPIVVPSESVRCPDRPLPALAFPAEQQ